METPYYTVPVPPCACQWSKGPQTSAPKLGRETPEPSACLSALTQRPARLDSDRQKPRKADGKPTDGHLPGQTACPYREVLNPKPLWPPRPGRWRLPRDPACFCPQSLLTLDGESADEYPVGALPHPGVQRERLVGLIQSVNVT